MERSKEKGVKSQGQNRNKVNDMKILHLAECAGGDGTLFGENVKIYDHNHIYKDVSIPIKIQGYTSAPITIEGNTVG